MVSIFVSAVPVTVRPCEMSPLRCPFLDIEFDTNKWLNEQWGKLLACCLKPPTGGWYTVVSQPLMQRSPLIFTYCILCSQWTISRFLLLKQALSQYVNIIFTGTLWPCILEAFYVKIRTHLGVVVTSHRGIIHQFEPTQFKHALVFSEARSG